MQLLQLLLLLVMLLGYSHADTDCFIDTIFRDQQKCYTDNGINITLSTFSDIGNTDAMKKNVIDQIATQDADVLCKNPEQLKIAIECVARRGLDCVPAGTKAYMPQPDKMAKHVDIICDKKNKVDYECVKRQTLNMLECDIEKTKKEKSNTQQTPQTQQDVETRVKFIMCRGFEITAECSNIALRPCGCSTVRAYEIIQRDYSYPPACPKLTGPRVQCDATNQDWFSDNGTGRQNSGSTVVFFVSVVAFIYFQFCST